MLKSFASDNNSGVHSEILYAITHANHPHYVSYGDDPYTIHAHRLFKETFGEQAFTYFVLTGTGANTVALQAITQRFEAVLCAETSHVHVDECGATEHILGSKILPLPSKHGKIHISDLARYLSFIGDQHHTQPKTISITQPTELGTLYTIAELKEIISFAKEHGMKVHMDGSRLSNAAVALKCSLKHLTTDLGIDILSFGGTKNGMMIGEAVVAFDEETAKNIPFIRKQNTQLLSKMRFVAAQFIAYLTDDLHLKNAKQANDMARLLYDALKKEVPEIVTTHPQCNALFVKMPAQKAHIMQKERFFYTWDETSGLYRFMTSFDMTPEDITDFVGFVKQVYYTM